jgi:flagellar protein FliS
MTGYGHGQYQRTQVSTVDSGRLIILLYEGAISFLKKAEQCHETNDPVGLSVNINRSLDIIDELDASLNMAEGGEIAANLRRLYQFMAGHLMKARSEQTGAKVKDVIQMMGQLNDAWKKAVTSQEAKETLANRPTPLKASTRTLVA